MSSVVGFNEKLDRPIETNELDSDSDASSSSSPSPPPVVVKDKPKPKELEKKPRTREVAGSFSFKNWFSGSLVEECLMETLEGMLELYKYLLMEVISTYLLPSFLAC